MWDSFVTCKHAVNASSVVMSFTVVNLGLGLLDRSLYSLAVPLQRISDMEGTMCQMRNWRKHAKMLMPMPSSRDSQRYIILLTQKYAFIRMITYWL